MGLLDLLSNLVPSAISTSNKPADLPFSSVTRAYESEDSDGDDPCAYCGHDPCWCPKDESDERRRKRNGEL